MENPIKMDDLGVPTFSETSIVSQRNQRDFQNFRSLYCTDSCCFASCLFVWKRRPDASRSKGIRHQGSYFWTVGARLSGPEQIGVIPQRTWWNQVVFLGNQEGFFWRTLSLWNTPIFVRLYSSSSSYYYSMFVRSSVGYIHVDLAAWVWLARDLFQCIFLRGFSAFPLPDDCGARNVVPVPMGVRKTQDAFGKRVGGSGRHLLATTGTTHCWSSW